VDAVLTYTKPHSAPVSQKATLTVQECFGTIKIMRHVAVHIATDSPRFFGEIATHDIDKDAMQTVHMKLSIKNATATLESRKDRGYAASPRMPNPSAIATAWVRVEASSFRIAF
jgi:hypothetical protein